MSAEEKVREKRDLLTDLAASDLNSAKWARELLEAANANHKCPCGGYLQSTDAKATFECESCGRRVHEQGGGE